LSAHVRTGTDIETFKGIKLYTLKKLHKSSLTSIGKVAEGIIAFISNAQ